MPPRVRVISVSGVPGSGKTALLEALAGRLKDAVVVRMDDFLTDSELMGKGDSLDLRAWLKAGADYRCWRCSPFEKAVRSLKRGRSASLPGQRRAGSFRHVLIEDPRGRCGPLSEVIDLSVYVDLPHDAALLRVLLRETEDPAWIRRHLRGFLQFQLGLFRLVCAEHRRQVRPAADLVVDGLQPLDRLAARIARRIVAL